MEDILPVAYLSVGSVAILVVIIGFVSRIRRSSCQSVLDGERDS